MKGNFSSDELESGNLTTDAAADSATSKVEVTVKILRKTTDTGALYTFAMDALQDDASAFSMNASLNKSDTALAGTFTATDENAKPLLELALAADYQDAKNVTCKLQGTAYDGDDQYAFVLTADQAVTDTAVNTVLSLSTGDSVDAIAADADNALLGTLTVNTVVQDDSGYFASIASATPEGSVEIMKLSDDDMTEYMSTLETAYMTVFYNIYANLPESVANALAQQMSSESN